MSKNDFFEIFTSYQVNLIQTLILFRNSCLIFQLFQSPISDIVSDKSFVEHLPQVIPKLGPQV